MPPKWQLYHIQWLHPPRNRVKAAVVGGPSKKDTMFEELNSVFQPLKYKVVQI